MSDSSRENREADERSLPRARIDGAAAPFLALLLLGFAVHLLVHQLNIVSLAGIPLGFYLAAQGAPVLLAIVLFWIAARRERVARHTSTDDPFGAVWGGAFGFPVYGVVGAGAIASGGIIAGFVGAMFLYGYDGLAYSLGLMIGLVVAALLVIPSRADSLAGSITGTFLQRYDLSIASACCVVGVGACLLLLLAAELSIVSTVFVRWLSISHFDAVMLAGALTMVFGVIVLMWRRLISLSLALSLAAIAFAIIGLGVASSMTQSGYSVPQLGYGSALREISSLERTLIVDQLADPDSLHSHVRPRTSFDAINFFAIAACFAFGIAAMPLLGVFRGFSRTPRGNAGIAALNRDVRAATMSLSLAWAGLFVCVLVVTLPAIAAYAKLDLFSWVRDGHLLSTLPTWAAPYAAGDLLTICGQSDLSAANLSAACGDQASRLALHHIALDADATVVAMPELAKHPLQVAMAFAGVLAVVGIVAGAYIVTSMVIEAGDVWTGDPEETSVVSRPTLAGRILNLFILVVMVAAGALLVGYLRPGSLALVSWALSLGASTIFPALVIGHYWPRVSAIAVVASMICGFCVCGFYIVATTYFASWFAITFQTISSAPSWQIDEINNLEATCLSVGGAVCTQFQTTAREAANWFGISNHASGLFGMPVAIGALALITLVIPRPKA